MATTSDIVDFINFKQTGNFTKVTEMVNFIREPTNMDL